ncbi:hypothetical protein SAMN05720382_105325 [Polaromonas sp. JS666]|nr:hypothetical protein SAMN05720382_105325 [Polaromonas sp. JS666]
MVINGNGLVQQRSAPTLTAALQYGAADRHLVGVTGGTSLSGTVNVLPNTGFSCGIGYGAVAASWTTGSFILKHRIEGANTKQFNGKTITVSGKLYQDTGGSRNLTVSLGKPTTTLDTFSAVTNLGTSSAIAVPSGTVTAFSYTLAMGSTDASLGLEVLITDNTTNTVSNKNYLVGDLQVEIGSVATVFEQRQIQTETALAQRYYETGTTYAAGHAPAGQFLGNRVGYKVQKRVTPTLVLTSVLAASVDASTTVAPTPAADASGFGVFRGGTASGPAAFGDTWTASAEL